jgi:hypothetical protein
VSTSALQTLSRIKLDVVETIRKAVDVVSTYAGAALPEGGKGRSLVRSLVLRLPERYFEAAGGGRRGIEGGVGGAGGSDMGGTGRDSEEDGGEMVTVRSVDVLLQCCRCCRFP